MRRELERIDRQIKRLVDVILEGGDAKAINVKLKELEAEKSRLTRELAISPKEEPLLHPNLAAIYRTRVDALEALFRDAEEGREAFETLRGLIEEVRIIPEDGEYRLELKGELAGILALAQGAKNSEREPAQRALQIKVVAGGCSPFCYNKYSWRSLFSKSRTLRREPGMAMRTAGCGGATAIANRPKMDLRQSEDDPRHLDPQPWSAIKALAVIAKLDLIDHEPFVVAAENVDLPHGCSRARCNGSC